MADSASVTAGNNVTFHSESEDEEQQLAQWDLDQGTVHSETEENDDVERFDQFEQEADEEGEAYPAPAETNDVETLASVGITKKKKTVNVEAFMNPPAMSSITAISRKKPRKSVNPTRRSVKKPIVGEAPHKKHRFRPGTVSNREVKQFQKSWNLLIQATPFERLVREIGQDFTVTGKTKHHATPPRWRPDAIEALQQGSEYFLIDIFSDAYEAAIEAGRTTLMPNDVTAQLRSFAKNRSTFFLSQEYMAKHSQKKK